MRPFFFYYFLILYLIPYSFSAAKKGDIVHEVCTRATGNHKELTYDFCKTILQAIPEKDRSNLQGLGTSSIRLVYKNVFGTRHIINVVKDKRRKQKNYLNVLNNCLHHYKTAIKDLNQAMKNWKRNEHENVEEWIAHAVTKATFCENAFHDSELKSPVIERYNDMRKLADIAIYISNQIG